MFLEGGDLLRVTEQELLVFGLRPGLELPEQLLAQVEQSRQAVGDEGPWRRLTGSRMLSKKQVMEHLTRKGGDRELAEDTAQWLEELGAVDESAYAARHCPALCRPWATAPAGYGRSCSAGASRRSCGTMRWPCCRRARRPSSALSAASVKGSPLIERRSASWLPLSSGGLFLAGYPSGAEPSGRGNGGGIGRSLPKGKLLLCKTTSGGIFLPIILLIVSGGSRSHFHRLSREHLLECSFARSQIHIPNIRGNTA